MSKADRKKTKPAKKTAKSKELDVKDLEKVTGGSLNFKPPTTTKPTTSR
jgi:hypothetical protein